MKLLLDLGNTRVKWAYSNDEGLIVGDSVGHADAEFIASLEEQWRTKSRPSHVVATSVANEGIGRQVRSLVSRLWNMDIDFLSSQAKSLGVVNGYAEPQTLGIDRWAALVAVYCQGGGPACVIDCGTAITVDAVDANGQHLGGLIVPGLRLMRGSLNRQTHAIQVDPQEDESDTAFRLGASTDAGVQMGILYAVRGFIEQTIAELKQSLGADLTCYITGGDADTLLAQMQADYRHEPDLVLKGLALLAETLD